MKPKLHKYGVFLLFLIVIIPLSFYITHTGAKESVMKDGSKQLKNETKAAKNGEKVSPANTMNGTDGANQENTTSDNNTVAVTPQENNTNKRDFLVVIDPGHQRRANTEQEPVGPGATETKIKVTGGTLGVATGKPEYQLALEASLELGQLLESKGVKVIYTRTTNDVNLSNRERAEIANQNNADLFVRIHADGSTDRNVHGLSVLTPAKNDPYTKAIFEDSLKASQFIGKRISEDPAVQVNGISYRSDMSGFNWSKVPSTLVEMGFMTNPTEDRNMSNQVYLKNLLTAIAEGIIQYANDKS